MFKRLTMLVYLLGLLSITAPGQTSLPSAVSEELENNASYKEAAQAMADRVYDIAATKFQLAMEDENLSDTAKPYLSLMLAEALVRASSSSRGAENLAEQALEILGDESVIPLETASIWKAEALASLGRYMEAEEVLSGIPPDHVLFSDIQLTRARMLLALDRSIDALDVLIKAGESGSNTVRDASNLLATEIYIDLGRFDDAASRLETISAQEPATAKLKEYLAARLALSGGDPADAINRFESLITAPNNLSERIFHSCIIAKADAQAANKQQQEAITTLENYIDNYPDSSLLQAAFNRLVTLLPDDLASDSAIMLKLREWSGEAPEPDDAIYIGGDSIAAMRPYRSSASPNPDLVSLALYHRAQLLARSMDPGKHNMAMALLALLRSQHASSQLIPSELYLQLSSASLLDTAYLHLKQDRAQQAAFTLSAMEKVAFSPRLKAQASFLRGLLLADGADAGEAMEAFDYARQTSQEDIARAATINTAMMALKSSQLEIFEQLTNDTQDNSIRVSLLLERALWRCAHEDASGRQELESFIVNNPGHPRENEARLALAAASVMISPQDINQAKAQLEVVAPRLTDATNQLAITRILIRAEELSGNWAEVATAAEQFTLNFPGDPNTPSLQLKRGEAYFHNEDYNKARRILQEIPEKYPDSPFSPYASFHAAMSARLGGTSQARAECIGMFQVIIDSGHELANESRIQQSRVLIDLRRYDEAEQCLKPILETPDIAPSLHRSAGVLMADCLHRQGAADPTKYEQAILIYNELLAAQNLPLAWKNRLHFLRGQTYESMNKTGKAFGSYYDVIIDGNTPTEGEPREEEWLWFYHCGFKALAMLERERRWEAAVKLARRIASFNGPRAEEAAKRANSLAKTHMIWEDIVPPAGQQETTGQTDSQ